MIFIYFCTENYQRQYGHVTSVTLNTGDTIWTMREQDARFQPVRLGTGKLNQSFSYDLRGNVTSRSVARANDTIQWQCYTYSPGTGNMLSRRDMINDWEESFGYDNLNRLTDISMTDCNDIVTEQETLYDGKGNILSRTDAGQFGYDSLLPYGISGLMSPEPSVPMREQYLHYNAMQQPDTIIENGYTATFSYYGDKSRAAMTVTGPNGYQLTCSYYDQQYNYYTKTENNVTTHKTVLWLGGSPYSAPAALLKDYGESTWQVVYVLRDNLGSITHVVDTTGLVLQEMGYTAWGQLRNPQTGEAFSPDAQPELLLGRGYTGHEHLPWFGLVNMNARLYDPALGRFLSPDPIVQSPDNTQNFNRYSYCMNNPLKFADPLGLMTADHKMLITDSGEILTMHGELDEVIIVCQWRKSSMKSSFSGGFVPMGLIAPYASLTWQYHIGEIVVNGHLDPDNRPPMRRSNTDPNWSNILNSISYSTSYLAFLTKGSKASFTFCKYKDLYELKISKKGYSKINGSKAYRVAGLSKFLSRGGYILNGISFSADCYRTYDRFAHDDIEGGLEYGVDAIVDFISMPLGIYGVALGLSWHYGLKNVFWYCIDINCNNIILPQYNNGTLGRPETMPFK